MTQYLFHVIVYELMSKPRAWLFSWRTTSVISCIVGIFTFSCVIITINASPGIVTSINLIRVTLEIYNLPSVVDDVVDPKGVLDVVISFIFILA